VDSGLDSLEDPLALNRFAYSINDPVNRVDRKGTSSEEIDEESFEGADIVEIQAKDKLFAYCKQKLNKYENQLGLALGYGEEIRANAARINDGSTQSDAYALQFYTNYYLARIPFRWDDRYTASDIFYGLGKTWSALRWGPATANYILERARKGFSILNGFELTVQLLADTCWRYHNLRPRLTTLINNVDFAVYTYSYFFKGLLDAII
jgi:hypothetical protein